MEGESGRLIGETLGGCRLVELLGVGGMAEVYRGVEPQLGREVAVKVLAHSHAAGAGYGERFRDEARRVSALNHPNIVPIYRFGEERGRLYLVMPLCSESLRDRLAREGRFEPAEAARICVQVAAGLDAAHGQGLVHRDVKPENILLDASGRAMLTDFGIAREVRVLSDAKKRSTMTGTGLPVGTPEYMAPEQLRGGPIDQRADVYALGAVLFEMLTGEPPYTADTVFEVAARALTERTPLPSERNPEIWPELDDVALGALAPDPETRYPNVRSMVIALRRAVLQRGATTTQLSVRDVAPQLAERAGDAPMAGLVPYGFPGFNAPTQALISRADTYVMPVWRPAQIQRSRRKLRAAALIALGLVVLLGSMTLGLALAPRFTQLSAWLAGGQVTLPVGDGLGPDGGEPSAAATATAQATAIGGTSTLPTQPGGGPGSTPTAIPTSTPSPTATSTPTPSISVASDPLRLSQTDHHKNSYTCVNIQRLTNTSTVSAPWTLSGVPRPAVNASQTSGILAAGGTTSITFTYIGPDLCNAHDALIAVIDSSGSVYTNFTLNY